MFRRTTALALLFSAGLTLPVIADEAGKTHWRVFIGDHASGKITALDLDQPEKRWSFDVEGPARIYAFGDGQGIAAVQGDKNRVDFLKTGVVIESHGDHSDIEVSEPAKLPTALTGGYPVHVVEHSGLLAVNFDKDGRAALADVKGLLAGDPVLKDFPQSVPHHGFAVVMGDYVLSTVSATEKPAGSENLPRLGLQAFDPAGKPVSELASCPGIHGEAFSGAYLAAGCGDGVLAVKADGAKPEFKLLPYGSDLPQGKTGTLLGVKGMQAFLGNYGSDGLVVVDPADAPHFTYAKLPARRVDFILDPAHAEHAFVLTEDGTLHRFNMLEAKIEASATVTEAYSMDGHWADPRPRLAIAGETVLLTDPRAGVIRKIDADTLKEAGTIKVEGVPYTIVSVGGSGVSH